MKYLWGPLRALLHSLPERSRIPVLSVVTGVLCGLAAVLLKVTIRGIHHGLVSLVGGSTWLFLLLPGVGMILSLLIVRYIVRDNIGHGVTKVLQAVSKNESKIKRHNLFSSMVTSALTIGFGGSVGAEAPIVYTGAAIGSNLGRYMGLSYRGMTLLLGCGAAGAVAGIFNAPLAGVLFTLEILLFNLSMSSLLPLLLSSVSATMVSYLILGRDTQFTCTLVAFSMRNIPFYLILGVFCGFCSLYFLKTTLYLEDVFGKMRNVWLRWALCAVGVGLLIFLFPPLYGEGYEDVGRLLNGQGSGAVWFFALILLLKVFAMTFTNAGGGVGGTFGPTLFVGAIAGYVLSSSLNLISPGLVPVPNFVLVGMAGLMAGVMQAPMTAIFLIAEISGGYELLLPLILTATIAYGTIRIFEKYSIYTKRIAQSGELLTHDSDQAVLTLLRTESLVETDFTPVRIDDTLQSLVDAVAVSERNIFPVLDGKKQFQGYVDLSDIRRDMFRTDLYGSAHVYNYMRSAPEYVLPDEPMESVMRKFSKTGAWNLPVVDRERHYLGFVSKSRIFNAYREELKDFSQD
ncbi:MAG: chloride channel protein [Bacteroidales bacterium]|nr:chloride channel protein [Bacteroidales bacterium]MBR6863409.1 chloride channel protein [Bacteroidales bacterium]